ncbi:MAG: TadE/TadG family type IV pilus assembly protein, partial [Pseudomonadota bacterium]
MILPVFLAVIFGIIEFGRMIWTRNTMEHAVEVAARWGAINTAKTDAEIEAYAATQLIVITSPPVAFSSTSYSSSVS